MKPVRETSRQNGLTYFVSSQTWQRQAFFRHERWAPLFLDTLFRYRGEAYLLHEFILMPDHFHILITPNLTLARSVQLIKGGFSRRMSLELDSRTDIWQRGFSDHRIRDLDDYRTHVSYIHRNPVKAGICSISEEYLFGSAREKAQLDPFPQGLKPLAGAGVHGTAEAVPLKSNETKEAIGLWISRQTT